MPKSPSCGDETLQLELLQSAQLDWSMRSHSPLLGGRRRPCRGATQTGSRSLISATKSRSSGAGTTSAATATSVPCSTLASPTSPVRLRRPLPVPRSAAPSGESRHGSAAELGDYQVRRTLSAELHAPPPGCPLQRSAMGQRGYPPAEMGDGAQGSLII